MRHQTPSVIVSIITFIGETQKIINTNIVVIVKALKPFIGSPFGSG